MAIYVFTLVTVVFLPLSAVASIFGINTADIRDTELTQVSARNFSWQGKTTNGGCWCQNADQSHKKKWAYWAAAIPLTVAVIVLGLWWMGELGNMFSWIGLKGKASGAAYASYVPSKRGGWYEGGAATAPGSQDPSSPAAPPGGPLPAPVTFPSQRLLRMAGVDGLGRRRRAADYR